MFFFYHEINSFKFNVYTKLPLGKIEQHTYDLWNQWESNMGTPIYVLFMYLVSENWSLQSSKDPANWKFFNQDLCCSIFDSSFNRLFILSLIKSSDLVQNETMQFIYPLIIQKSRFLLFCISYSFKFVTNNSTWHVHCQPKVWYE